mmetsp:Transcript_48642/g.121774  ORF Transcript_48642/g.121774 Transcript_48642/m.121774 type:complete len:90 (-) Transcript_48642:951-1220(-)
MMAGIHRGGREGRGTHCIHVGRPVCLCTSHRTPIYEFVETSFPSLCLHITPSLSLSLSLSVPLSMSAYRILSLFCRAAGQRTHLMIFDL